MSLLDRKLVRDIVALRGQVVTIALVVAAGVAVFIASVSTYDSLLAGRDRFYDSARFPQVFVALKRAPLSIVPRLSMIPGVATVEPRIVRDVIVDWPSSALPVSARVVSLGRAGAEPLARLYMRRGTAPGAHDTRDAVVNEAFAEANGVKPGTHIGVILNGKLQHFTISGIVLSPEYVYAVKPGLPIPDDRFFAVLWVDRSAAEAAFDMIGAFNDLVISLAPGTDPKQVIADLDRLLEPYGSVGAVERRDQSSNRFLEDELNEQKVMAITVPAIFFGVAAFLLNVALGRQVAAQREQIAALKARLPEHAACAALPEARCDHRAPWLAPRACRWRRLRPRHDGQLPGVLLAARPQFRSHVLVGRRGNGHQLCRRCIRSAHRSAHCCAPDTGSRHAPGATSAIPPVLAGATVVGVRDGALPHHGGAQYRRPAGAGDTDHAGHCFRHSDRSARAVLA